MSEPRWLTVEDVVELNHYIVTDTGEPFNLLDAGLVESACYNPINRYLYDGEEDVVTLAVALMIAISRNHGFEQGNKRTGFEAGVLFLEVNGFRLELPDIEAVAHLMVGIISHEADEEEFEDLIRIHLEEN